MASLLDQMMVDEILEQRLRDAAVAVNRLMHAIVGFEIELQIEIDMIGVRELMIREKSAIRFFEPLEICGIFPIHLNRRKIKEKFSAKLFLVFGDQSDAVEIFEIGIGIREWCGRACELSPPIYMNRKWRSIINDRLALNAEKVRQNILR